MNVYKQRVIEKLAGIAKNTPPLYQDSSFYEGKGSDTMRRYDIHHKGKNIAYASIRPTSTEGDGPWVSGVWVDPEHRGKGLSRRLLGRIAGDYPGQKLRLLPRPYKDKALTKEQLTTAYGKMGFKPYDEKGRMVKQADRTYTHNDTSYDVEKLWKVKGRAREVSPDKLLGAIGKTWGRGPDKHGWKDVVANPEKYPRDAKKIREADLSYPILMWKGRVVDGVHRLVKAKQTGEPVSAITLSSKEMKQAVTKREKAKVIAHIAGPSGSGKTTMLERIKEKHPNIAAKDLDEIDDVAKAELGITGRKRNWSDEKLTKFYSKKQEVLDRFLAENKGKDVVLAGHHVPGGPSDLVESWSLKVPGEKVLLDTGARKSARRRSQRGSQPGTENIPEYRAEAKKTIKDLKSLGYRKKSPKEILKLVDKLSSDPRKPTAVIVKGNPDHIAASNVADKTVSDFHSKLKKIMESEGYAVSFDPGLPHTSPKKADIWIGHSRGAGRLRFAPKETLTIPVGSSRPGAINHPVDQKWMDTHKDKDWGSIPAEERPPVPVEHMVVNRKMEKELRSRVRAYTRTLASGKRVRVKGHTRDYGENKTVELSGEVQGVGLRRAAHKKLDELGRKRLSSAASKKAKATREGRQYSSHGLAAGTSLKMALSKTAAKTQTAAEKLEEIAEELFGASRKHKRQGKRVKVIAKMLKTASARDPRLERAGVSGYNKPKRTPGHPTKSHIVVAKEGDSVKTIRFGQQGVKTNQTAGQRKAFKSRHAKNISRGKMSAAYWADKAKWSPSKTKDKDNQKWVKGS